MNKFIHWTSSKFKTSKKCFFKKTSVQKMLFFSVMCVFILGRGRGEGERKSIYGKILITGDSRWRV